MILPRDANATRIARDYRHMLSKGHSCLSVCLSDCPHDPVLYQKFKTAEYIVKSLSSPLTTSKVPTGSPTPQRRATKVL